VDYVLPVEEMSRVIMGLLLNRRGGKMVRRPARTETPSAERPEKDALRGNGAKRPSSPFTCPDCGGTLWEIKEGDLIRYRCHVGHGFTVDSLRDGMDNKVEEAMWSALRIIEEAIELRGRMQARAKRRRLSGFVDNLEEDIATLKARAEALRNLLVEPRQASRRRQPGRRIQKPRTRHAYG
jgi:two-component system, chemotaxis family, protein-glutamate methylesterase/glutaminase